MIIRRYLTRELITSLLSVMTVLLLIMISNVLIRYLTDAANGAMQADAVLKLVGMSLPQFVALLLPISLFFAILLVYGRLFSDNELTTMFACGMSWKQLIKITFMPAVIIAMIVGVLSLYVMPKMQAYKDIYESSVSNKNSFSFVQPGRFVTPGRNGQQVIYVGSAGDNNQQVQNLFIYRHLYSNKPPQIIIAPKGHQEYDRSLHQQVFVMENGVQYTGWPTKKKWRVSHFSQYKIVNNNASTADLSHWNAQPSWVLLRSNEPGARATLQWRISLPLACLVMTLVGLAMCYVRPRQGRFAKVFAAVLLFIVYFNLLSFSQSWLDQGKISHYLGLWWVHIVFASVAALWLYRAETGRLPWERT